MVNAMGYGRVTGQGTGPGTERHVQRLLCSVGAALEELSKLGVRPWEAVQLARARRMDGIPLSIFNPHLGALESIVKYMRDELSLDYASIARILNRNEGPIGVTYRRAKAKHDGTLDMTSADHIPFGIFSNKKLSVFENIAYYLAKQGRDWHDIAMILHRNDKTVWTVLDRAKRKMKEKGAGRG